MLKKTLFKISAQHFAATIALVIIVSGGTLSAEPVELRPVWNYPALAHFQRVTAETLIGGEVEIYTLCNSESRNSSNYWVALAWNGVDDYEPVYTSQFYVDNIIAIATGDVTGDSRTEIIVALGDGEIHLYDQVTKHYLSAFSTTASLAQPLGYMRTADLDGVGKDEIVVHNYADLAVFADGQLQWKLADQGNARLAIGQLDTDPALEIVTANGKVVDSGTRSVQWNLNANIDYMAVGDLDGDSLDELVSCNPLRAYDVDTQTQKWLRASGIDASAIAIADSDGDGALEIILGQSQWGNLRGLDALGESVIWSIANPGHTVYDITVADSDADGKPELIWATSSNLNRASPEDSGLFIANTSSQVIEWKNAPVGGPFTSVATGDLDGDGEDEVVVTTPSSRGGLLVFDKLTMRLRGTLRTSGLSPGSNISDLKLIDVDADGKKEILIAVGGFSSAIEVYDYSQNDSFSLQWSRGTGNFLSMISCVDAYDVDGDGTMEIIAGGGSATNGRDDSALYIYDYASKAEEWRSPPITPRTQSLKVADLDNKPGPEIFALMDTTDLYILDAATRELRGYIPGPFEVMQIIEKDIFLANASGELHNYRYDGSDYSFVTSNSLTADQRIEGFDVVSKNPLKVLFGSQGKLHLFQGDTVLARTPDFGYFYGSSITDAMAVGSHVLSSFTLPAPTLQLESIGVSTPGSTKAKWNQIVSGAEYRVQAARAATFDDAVDSGWINQNTHSFNDLPPGLYYYRVMARTYDALTESMWSRIESMRHGPNPAAAADWALYF